MKKKKQIKTLNSKFTLLFVLLALMLCVVLCLFYGLITWQKYTDFYWEKALAAAKMAASYVDGDRIGSYLETGTTDAYYDALFETLQVIRREQNTRYLYIYIPAEDHFTYVMDVTLPQDDLDWYSQMGDVYEYTKVEYTYLLDDVKNARPCQQKILLLQNAYGPGVSAWAPVLDSAGNVAAMVECDVTLDVVIDALRDFLLEAIGVCCALVLIVVLALSVITRKMVSRPIARLTENVRSFVQGDTLTYPQEPIQTGDEIQTLSEAFGKMAEDIEAYTKNVSAIAAEKERISTELTLATDIQTSLLQQKFPAYPERDEFDLYAAIQPAKVVGGDFYDFFLIDARHLGVVAGSISGRGIPAALFMVVAKTVIKNQMMTGMPVEEAMSVINARLYETSTANMTVHAFVGVLDTSDGTLCYVNAGETVPILMRRDSAYEFLSGQKMSPLAQTEHISYRRMTLTLRQGDRLVLCSRGVLETRDASGRPFGADRLHTALNSRRASLKTLKILACAIRDEVLAFAEETPQEDITVLALSYQKGDRALSEITVPAQEESFQKVRAFLRRQLEENGLGGAFYAEMALAAEEAFSLLCSRVDPREQVLARCAVEQEAQGRKVTVTLLSGGLQEEPLCDLNEAQQDAEAFLRRTMDEVRPCAQDGRRGIALSKRV